MSTDNKSLGTFRLDGIPPAPRGVPQIEVIFDIDANGILNVTAKDKGSGKEQSISITGASTLDKSEVERMVQQAEQNASTDKERREKIERKNQADSLAYQAEKQIADLGDKVPADDKTKIEEMVKNLRDAIASENDEQIKVLMPELQQTLYTIGANLYQQGGGGAAPGTPGDDGGSGTNPPPSGDDVIDADFTESK